MYTVQGYWCRILYITCTDLNMKKVYLIAIFKEYERNLHNSLSTSLRIWSGAKVVDNF